MFQFCICCIPLGIRIEVRRPINFDGDGPIFSSRYVAVLVRQGATKAARKLLHNLILLLLLLFCEHLLLTVQEALPVELLPSNDLYGRAFPSRQSRGASRRWRWGN